MWAEVNTASNRLFLKRVLFASPIVFTCHQVCITSILTRVPPLCTPTGLLDARDIASLALMRAIQCVGSVARVSGTSMQPTLNQSPDVRFVLAPNCSLAARRGYWRDIYARAAGCRCRCRMPSQIGCRLSKTMYSSTSWRRGVVASGMCLQ